MFSTGSAVSRLQPALRSTSSSPPAGERRCSGFQKISKPDGSMQCRSRSLVLNQMSEIWMSPVLAPAALSRSRNSLGGGGGSMEGGAGLEMSDGARPAPAGVAASTMSKYGSPTSQPARQPTAPNKPNSRTFFHAKSRFITVPAECRLPHGPTTLLIALKQIRVADHAGRKATQPRPDLWLFPHTTTAGCLQQVYQVLLSLALLF